MIENIIKITEDLLDKERTSQVGLKLEEKCRCKGLKCVAGWR